MFDPSNETALAALRAAGVGTWTWHLDTNVLEWSDQCRARFGLSQDEPIDMDRFYSLIHPEDRARAKEAMDAALESGGMYDVELRAVWPNGEAHWLRARGSSAPSEGRPDLFQGIVIDIDPRKRLQQERDDLFHERQAVLDSAGDGIYRIGLDGACTFINKAALQMTGYTAEEVRGQNTHALLHSKRIDGSPYPVSECPIFQTLASGVGSRIEDEVIWRKDGKPVPVTYSAQPIKYNGRVDGAVVTLTDMTHRRSSEAALRESEAFKSAIVENALDCVITIDANSRVVEFNPAAERTFGYTRAQALGRDMAELIVPPAMRSAHRAGMRNFLTTGEGPILGKRIEVNAVRADGTEFPVELSVTAIPSTETPYFTAYMRNITDRKQADLALRESEERFRTAVEAMSDIVWTSDEKGMFRGVQSGWRTFTGQTQAEYEGMGWTNAIHPDDVQATIAAWTQALANGSLFSFEHRLRRKDGMYRRFSIKAAPVAGERGVREWVGVHTDVTELRHAEDQLVQAKEAADKANTAKSEFLASMSHELRTPLNAIIGYSEMLQEEADDSGAASMIPDLQKIHVAGKHLLALINDVLDLSKIEAGKMDLFVEPFDIGEMIRDVVSTVEPMIQNNQNDLLLNLDPELGSMNADLTKVRQILLNLLSNASKFTNKGVITLESRRDSAGWLDFKVIDSGIGMDADKLAQIFDAFAQADRTTARKYGGTGLGLAISRKFAQLMGGDISVRSKPGQGSTFTLRLPGGPARTPALPSFGIGGGEAVANGVILIIDDDPSARDLMARTFAREGIVAETAANGPDGIRRARELKPALIVLDVLMPGMDGWTVLTTLKADAALCDTPVIMVSMVDKKDLGFLLGAADYLVKPVGREQLVRLLKRYHCGSKPCRVLLVDDDASARAMLRQTLEREGWTVAEAKDGKAALAQIESDRPQLILLDLMMPGMDGFEFTDEFSRHPEWYSIPIVVLTAKDLTAAERERLSGSVQRILHKGAQNRQQLIEEIRRAASRGRPAQ